MPVFENERLVLDENVDGGDLARKKVFVFRLSPDRPRRVGDSDAAASESAPDMPETDRDTVRLVSGDCLREKTARR